MTKIPTARVLVIDDNPEVVDILATCLREEGYGVLGALTRLAQACLRQRPRARAATMSVSVICSPIHWTDGGVGSRPEDAGQATATSVDLRWDAIR